MIINALYVNQSLPYLLGMIARPRDETRTAATGGSGGGGGGGTSTESGSGRTQVVSSVIVLK